MTLAQKTRKMVDEMQSGLRPFPFPLASFRELQNCQDHIDKTGYAATINNDVCEWYGKRGFIIMDYGIGYRMFANKAAWKAQ